MSMDNERLTYESANGESVELSLSSVYHVNIRKDVTGLSDIQNELYAITSMGQDGETYLSQRLASRTIEISGNIRERDHNVSDRHKRTLTHILSPANTGRLVYELRGRRRVIDCILDNSPKFTPGAVYDGFTVVLRCPYPLWREKSEERTDVASWAGGFELPEPDGLEIYESDTTWEIGYREPALIVNVYNPGDWSAGVRAEFRALGTLTNPSLLNVKTGKFIRLTNLQLTAGDKVVISTGYGQKRITLTRGGVTFDAFQYWDIDSTYFELEPGDNLFSYDADSGKEMLEVSIYHDNYYLGVS
jgi:hypothetical protein